MQYGDEVDFGRDALRARSAADEDLAVGPEDREHDPASIEGLTRTNAA